VEAGLDEVERARSTSRERTVCSRTESLGNSISEGMKAVASSLTAPIELSIASAADGHSALSTRTRIEEFNISDRVARTVEKLMLLESNIREKIKDADADGDFDYKDALQQRLKLVRKRIGNALA